MSVRLVVEPFADRYDLAAPLFEVSARELRQRDEEGFTTVRRWLALDDGVAVGVATAWLRPDDRMFLTFRGEPAAAGPLSDVALAALEVPVHATADEDESGMLAALHDAGFVTEMVSERFRVRFDAVLEKLARAWIPSGFEIVSAAEADPDRLFVLDTRLRQDTPGSDGWRGNRRWFLEELSEAPPFDPDAYLVAVNARDGEYAGVVRIWRNPDGPRFGFIGVARPHRATSIAAALMRQALAAAADWGHASFVTETSLTNRQIHPRLTRLASSRLGRFHQLVRIPNHQRGPDGLRQR